VEVTRETLVRIVLLGIPSGDCGVSEEFRALNLDSAGKDANCVIV
jgi:hypothetical protein